MARKRWTRESIIQAVRARYAAGRPMSTAWKDDSTLVAAAYRHLGSWREAMAAAGVPNAHEKPQRQRKCTRAQIVEALRARHQSGQSMESTWREAPALYAVAKRYFGRWNAALSAAGLESIRPRKWTYENVLQEITCRHERGLPLIGVWRDEPPLFNAAKKHFGTWHSALRAAGLPAREHRSWSREKVLTAIQTIDNQGQALSRVWRTDKPLFQAAVRYFGNWENALRAAGLDPQPRRRWTRDHVIDELLASHF